PEVPGLRLPLGHRARPVVFFRDCIVSCRSSIRRGKSYAARIECLGAVCIGLFAVHQVCFLFSCNCELSTVDGKPSHRPAPTLWGSRVTTMKLILASASERRASILRDAGIPFIVMSSAVDETPG